MENTSQNPFYGLFSSKQHAQALKTALTEDISSEPQTESTESATNRLLERIFLITINQDFSDGETDLTEHAVVIHTNYNGKTWMDIADLKNFLIDRLLLEDLPDFLVTRNGKNLQSAEPALESDPLVYLFACYGRAYYEIEQSKALDDVISSCQEIIVSHVALFFLQPMMFCAKFPNESDIAASFFNILKENCQVENTQFHTCLQAVSKFLAKESPEGVETVFTPICRLIVDHLLPPEVTLGDYDLKSVMQVLAMLSRVQEVSSVILDFTFDSNLRTPDSNKMNCILGILLGKSSLITDPVRNDHPYFQDVSRHSVDQEEDRLHTALGSYHTMLHQIFRNIVRCDAVKDKLLIWIGTILFQNSAAGKMWIHELSNPLKSVYKSDAVFQNLSAVLVNLSMPFCISNKTGLTEKKFMKIDAAYCKATSSKDRFQKAVHLFDLNKETAIISSTDDNSQTTSNISSSSYGFITECFFMTHASLRIGMHGLLTKFYKLTRELNHLQGAYQEALAFGGNSEFMDNLKSTFERAMAVHLSTKATLCEPKFLESMMRFCATTSSYLNQLALGDQCLETSEIDMQSLKCDVRSLQLIPEFVVENVCDFLIFLKRYNPSELERETVYLNIFLAFCMLYMGEKSRMTNPHLRASLAEVLEALLPIGNDDMTASHVKTITFKQFKHVKQLSYAVLQLFVDIEFTGDPHAFEQKFNYRQPLYNIMSFIWTEKRGKKAFAALASEAVLNIEMSQPPLFLRFINLLLNDSIFLLDEATDHLAQIKTQELQKENGEWENLSEDERKEKEKSLRQLIQLSRFFNIMSNETIKTIAYLSSDAEVRNLLCQKILIDRLASMLNNILLRLVGPKMGELKIRDFSKCDFKPQVMVTSICQIYSNLGQDTEFLKSVAVDQRSYSSDLFPRTLRVLRKLGHIELSNKLKAISEQVRKFQGRAESAEELLEGAPDEFFDPILGTLMQNPVVLPSSKQVVDRSTIARHLLSDPSDPFNRQPLKLDDVIEDSELSARIQSWLSQHET